MLHFPPQHIRDYAQETPRPTSLDGSNWTKGGWTSFLTGLYVYMYLRMEPQGGQGSESQTPTLSF